MRWLCSGSSQGAARLRRDGHRGGMQSCRYPPFWTSLKRLDEPQGSSDRGCRPTREQAPPVYARQRQPHRRFRLGCSAQCRTKHYWLWHSFALCYNRVQLVQGKIRWASGLVLQRSTTPVGAFERVGRLVCRAEWFEDAAEEVVKML